MLSTLPPDSALAWPVAYTGLGLHSLLKTTPFNVEEYKLESSNLESLLAKRILGRAYWDRLGQENYKVCLLFPYPLNKIVSDTKYHINGMAVFLTENDQLRFFSQGEEEEIVRAIRDVWKKKGHIEEKKQKGFYESFKRDLELFTEKTEILYQVLDRNAFDLTYFFSDILEWQHLFWNRPKHLGLIYRRVEDFLLKLIRRWGDTYLFMIHSDHGFTGRPMHLLNIAKAASHIFFDKSVNAVSIMRNAGRFLASEMTCMLGLEKFVLCELYPRIKKRLNLQFRSDFLEIVKRERKANFGVFYDPSYELRDFCGFYVESDKTLKVLLLALERYTDRVYNGIHDSRLREIMAPTSNVAIKLKGHCTFYNDFAPAIIRNPQARIIPGMHGFEMKLYLFSGPYEVKRVLQDQPGLLMDVAPTILGMYGIADKPLSDRRLIDVEMRQ